MGWQETLSVYLDCAANVLEEIWTIVLLRMAKHNNMDGPYFRLQLLINADNVASITLVLEFSREN